MARSERFELPTLGIEILGDSRVINGLIGSCCIRVALGCEVLLMALLMAASVKRKPADIASRRELQIARGGHQSLRFVYPRRPAP